MKKKSEEVADPNEANFNTDYSGQVTMNGRSLRTQSKMFILENLSPLLDRFRPSIFVAVKILAKSSLRGSLVAMERAVSKTARCVNNELVPREGSDAAQSETRLERCREKLKPDMLLRLILISEMIFILSLTREEITS